MRKFISICVNIPSCISLAFILLAVLVTFSNVSAETQNDFDGDGKSDYTTIDIINGSLQWKAFLSGSSQSQSIASIGANGDQVILAPWFDALTINPGIVTLDGTTKKIRWDVIHQNEVQSRYFGNDGDLVVPGDFDGDGVYDAGVARIVGKNVKWEFLTNLFQKSADTSPAQITFGAVGDRVFFARPQGGVKDWACVVRKGTSNRSRVICRDLLDGSQRVDLKRFPSYAAGSLRPRPFPVHQASGPDILGFELINGSTTTYRFTDFNGTELFSTQISEKSPIAVVGEYNDFSGEEVQVQGQNVSYLINPVAKIVTSTPKTSGIPVDQYNINTLKSGSSDAGGNSNNGSGNNNSNNNNDEDSGGSAPSGGLGGVCSSVAPLSGLLIKAEISHHISPGDVRSSGFTLICGQRCVQFVAKFYYCDGSEAGSFGYYGKWNVTGKSRAYGGAGGAPPHSVSTIRRTASTKRCGSNLYLKTTAGGPSACMSFSANTSRIGSPY